MADLAHPLCSALNFAGRGAFSKHGILSPLVKRFERNYQKDIWSWTGYTWEEMMENPDKLELYH